MPKPQPSFAHRWLIGNLRNKGTSLIFAILIWVYAFSNTKEIEEASVRVAIVSGSPEQVVLTTSTEDGDPFTGDVLISLEGPRSLLRIALDELSEGQFVVEESGLVLLDAREGYPSLPPGVDVVKAIPRYVDVELDLRETREIVIKPNGLIVTPSRRFRPPTLDEYRFEPASVEVQGPASMLDNVGVRFNDVRVEGHDTENWSVILPLLISGERHRELSFVGGPVQVQARVTLRSSLVERTFTVPILYGLDLGTAFGPIELSGQSRPVAMTCFGTEEALDELQIAIDTGKFQIWIPIQDTSGTIDSVQSSSFRWPESGLPAGIERSSLIFDPEQIPIKVDRLRDDDESGEQE